MSSLAAAAAPADEAAHLPPVREATVPPVRHGVMRFASIEGLRFWMAWWVVLGHAANLTGIPRYTPAAITPLFNGSVAVNVFVIVSGFVVTHLIVQSGEPYGSYLARRAMRLWPVYLLALAVLLAVPQMFRFAFIELPFGYFRAQDAVRQASVEANLGTHVALHLLMLHSIVPDEWLAYSDSAILSPAWSLSLEWQFYLIAPFWIALIRRGRATAIASSIVVLALVAILHAQDRYHWRFPGFLPMSMHFFLLGIVSRLLLDRMWIVRRPLLWLAAGWALAAVLLVVADRQLGFQMGREIAIWTLFSLFVVYENGRIPDPVPGWLRAAHRAIGANRVLGLLGSASYSTYILHLVLFSAALYLCHFLFAIDTQARAIAIVFGTAVLVAPISIATYHLVEQPCNAWARRRLKRPGRHS